jgi:hypothetical protein
MLFPQHTFKENSIMANILPETDGGLLTKDN